MGARFYWGRLSLFGGTIISNIIIMIVATVLTVPQRQTSGGSVTSSGRVLTSTLCRQTTLLRFCHLDHQLGASYFKSSTSTLEPIINSFAPRFHRLCPPDVQWSWPSLQREMSLRQKLLRRRLSTPGEDVIINLFLERFPTFIYSIAGRVLKRRELRGPRTLLGHRSNVLPTKAVLLRGRLLWAWLQQEEPQQGQEAAGGLVHQAGPQ